MHAGLEAGGIGIEMDAHATWCQTAWRSDTDDTCIAFNKRSFVYFSEIVHFSDQKLSEPRCDNAIAVVVVHFGGVEQWF